MSAGELRELIAFDVRQVVLDAYGNERSTFVEQFQRPARVQPLRGGEAVQQSRLEGIQPVLIIVRYDPQTILVQVSWQARDVRRGTIYAIQSVANMDEHRAYLDILATTGRGS
jgi:head-tail adaptor